MQQGSYKQHQMSVIIILVLMAILGQESQAQLLPGFRRAGLFDEQQLVLENLLPDTRLLINAPLKEFEKGEKVLLVFYALPNGNSIEQTIGKKTREGDDWHYNIQHIGAQTRYLRQLLKKQTIVTVYLETTQKSWPAWAAKQGDSVRNVKTLVDQVKALFEPWYPQIVLNGHSGGGRFLFSYLDAVEEIPDEVVRIAFLDSNYGYTDSLAGPKLVNWLKSGKERYLCTLAYNDSVVLYNGKRLVSPTGGTWYRTRVMQKYLARLFDSKTRNDDSLWWYSALKNRIAIVLKTNTNNKIYHTTQVERNGFIHSLVSGTRHENSGYTYFGERAYAGYIADSVVVPIRRMNIPARQAAAETGSAFVLRIESIPLKEREEEIFRAISSGNIPEFLRNTVTLKGEFADSAGMPHQITYEAMPDYLAIGNNQDFCRMPMNPLTAQKLADQFGASLVTAKLSDNIYRQAEVKLAPFFYAPVGNANEQVTKFAEHNAQINKQFGEAGGKNGQLVAGTKKDVILSSRMEVHPGKVVIYGWHKPDGQPIQSVYSGHVNWYVDYSHGIRLINNQVLVDGQPRLLSELLKDPLLYTLFSDEKVPMKRSRYQGDK